MYAEFFKLDNQQGVIPEGSPVVISPQELLPQLTKPVVLAGPGVTAYRDIFAGYDHIELFPNYLAAPSALLGSIICYYVH